MSRSVDLFIDCYDPIEEVAACIRRLTRADVGPGEVPGTWSLQEGALHADLRVHPFVDEGDLVLQRYRYVLSSRVAHGGRSSDAPETIFLRLVSEALRGDGVPTLLVHDLQYRDAGAGAAAPRVPSPPDASSSQKPGSPDGALRSGSSADGGPRDGAVPVTGLSGVEPEE